jgi:hypothetical protein
MLWIVGLLRNVSLSTRTLDKYEPFRTPDKIACYQTVISAGLMGLDDYYAGTRLPISTIRLAGNHPSASSCNKIQFYIYNIR